MYSIDILMRPTKHGYIECNYCSGLGSLDRLNFGHIICSVCNGSGILKIKSNKDLYKKKDKVLLKFDKKESYVVK
jgi:hypothetical protein